MWCLDGVIAMFFRRKKPTPVTFEGELEDARNQGFTVEIQPDSPSHVRLAKHGCAAVIGREGPAGIRFQEKPGVVVHGEIARLVDRGYQKFLITRDGRDHPAQADQLKALHQFNAELRHAFRLTSLYNESLGTVSDRYHYDRLEGRD